MSRPKAGGLESLFSNHKEAPMAHRDVYPVAQMPQSDRKRANATMDSKSRSATGSYENIHHYAKAPKVDIARVMDVGSGEKKKNVTVPTKLQKKEEHEDPMASLKEELVEQHGKLPKAHASDEPPELPEDDTKTKNGKKQPKKDPAWSFMMSEIKKNEAPPTPDQAPQTDPAPAAKQPPVAQPAPAAQPNRPPPPAEKSSPAQSQAPPSGETPQSTSVDSTEQRNNAAVQSPTQADSTQNLRSNQPPNAPPLSDVRGIIKEFKSIQ